MKTHADMTKLLFSKEEIDVKVAEIANELVILISDRNKKCKLLK